ncbi:hypothetical protein DSO57_1038080 [Entomophthora muscae]|uniref:Uncharacterized protein n=1 Tax=Entomophthora muscae TaxID=34485 RepID=A0ACC2RPR8_9FUNG|nr:hypothetical protein DSO57_1038080 [Entomophthora muscae]
MRVMVFVCILISGAIPEPIPLSEQQAGRELFDDYCFEKQYEFDAGFNPLETLPQIQKKAREMLGGAEDELVLYSKSVFVTIWSRIAVSPSSLVDLLLYYESIHRYGVDSIRKLYFDQLCSIELVKQTAFTRATEVLLVHSSDFDFYNYSVYHQETLAEIDSLTMAAIQKIYRRYTYLLSTLDYICHEEDFPPEITQLTSKVNKQINKRAVFPLLYV